MILGRSPVANSYSRLANLSDEDEAPKKKGSGYSRLATLGDDDSDTPAATVTAASDDGLPADYPRHEDGESTGEWWKKELAALTRPENWKRQAKLAGRSVIEGIESLPMMAMDMGVAGRNLVTGSNYQLPSEMNKEALNTVLPHPKTASEKVAGFVESVLAGSRLPAPTVAKGAPEGFVSPAVSPAQQLLREAQEAGYKVPPASASGSMVAKGIESVAGKTSVAQAASAKNQEVTNELARQALKLENGEPITPELLHGIRQTAGKVYAEIADSGDIIPDAKYLDDLSQLGRGADEVAQAFPGANVGATKQISELVDSLLQDKFSSKAAMQYLRELRKMASGNLSGINAADPAKKALGMAQREAAGTLEEMVMRHLVNNGMEETAQAFDGARKAIAVSYTVENALNESTSNVIAGKLGQQLARGKPLSGELELAAKFSRAFPKASKEITESMPGASPLDWSLGGILSAVLKTPYTLLMAGVRPTARAIALSDPVQRSLTGAAIPYAPPSVLGLAPSAALQAEQQ